MTTRRTVLTALAGLPVVAALAPAGRAAGNPDAALLRAYADWIEASRIRDGLPDDWEDEAFEPYDRAISEALGRLRAIPATTPEGIAVKLRWLWQAQSEALGHYNVIVHGAPLTDDLLEDCRARMLWNLIAEVEALGGAALAA